MSIYTREWYFHHVEPRILQGESQLSICESLGLNWKFAQALRKKYNGTSPRKAKILLQIAARRAKLAENNKPE